MEIEIQGIPHSVRAQYHARLRTAKSDLSRYKKLLKDQNSQIARADLLSSSRPLGAPSDDPYAHSSDRTRLLAGTSMLEEGSKRLQESHRIALETETQGSDILLNLRTQREQIENARSTVCLEHKKYGLM
jgi:vesicle transport through interaction with t-SNAREs protein 1